MIKISYVQSCQSTFFFSLHLAQMACPVPPVLTLAVYYSGVRMEGSPFAFQSNSKCTASPRGCRGAAWPFSREQLCLLQLSKSAPARASGEPTAEVCCNLMSISHTQILSPSFSRRMGKQSHCHCFCKATFEKLLMKQENM